MFCQYCGKEIPAGAAFCPSCGANLQGQAGGAQAAPQQPQQPVVVNVVNNNRNVNENINGSGRRLSYRSRLVAVILCIFFGVLGAHRFYVGKVGTGLVYLFTAGLLGIGWIIDLVMLLAGSFRDSYGDLLR